MTAYSVSIYNRFKPSSLIAEIPVLIGFNLLLIATAYMAINLPFSPVPITGQTFGVLLIAMALDRTRAVAVVGAYVLEGMVGLPVFAGGKAGIVALAGPTGGYIIGFLAAAYIVGYLADRGWSGSYIKSVAAMTLGTAIIFACGLTWLTQFIPGAALLTAGLIPFIPGAIMKIGLAAVILPTIWRGLDRRS